MSNQNQKRKTQAPKQVSRKNQMKNINQKAGSKNQKNLKNGKKPVEQDSPNRVMRFTLIGISAALLVVIGVVTGVLIAKFSNNNEIINYNNELQGYDYEKLKPENYLDLGGDDIVGLKDKYRNINVDMAAYYEKYVKENDPVRVTVDQKFVDQQIAYMLLSNRKIKNEKKPNVYDGVIGFGDQVNYHILSATCKNDKGELVSLPDEMINGYRSLGSLTVGEGYLFGEEFDRALIGLNPKDTAFYERQEVAIDSLTDSDVVRVIYTATVDGKTVPYIQENGKRVVLAEKDDITAMILEKSKGLITGETVTFDRKEDINKDGKTETVHYKATVASVVEEKSVTVTAHLPEKFFGEKDEEMKDYLWMNGKEVTFTLILPYFADYNCTEVSALTADGIEELLKSDYVKYYHPWLSDFKIQNKEQALAEFRTAISKQFLEDQKKAREEYEIAALGLALMDKVSVKEYPQKVLELTEKAMYEQLNYQYNAYWYQMKPGEFKTLEDFAIAMGMYKEDEYKNIDEYVKDQAQKEVLYNLLLVGIMNAEGLEPTDEQEKEAYNEIVEREIKAAKQAGHDVKETDVWAKYSPDGYTEEDGKAVLLVVARKEAFTKLVVAKLRTLNTFDYSKMENAPEGK